MRTNAGRMRTIAASTAARTLAGISSALFESAWQKKAQRPPDKANQAENLFPLVIPMQQFLYTKPDNKQGSMFGTFDVHALGCWSFDANNNATNTLKRGLQTSTDRAGLL